VIQTEHLDPGAAAWLAHHAEVVKCDSGDARFPELLARAQALVIRTYTRIDRALLERAPRLRVVGRAGVGLDNVDIPACQARGVAVVSTPDANTRAVVEYVFALLLDALRPRLFLEKPIPDSQWKALREELKAPKQLCELTLGIWGLGRIGRQIARAAAALDIPTIYHDLLEIAPEHRFGARPVSREELVRTSDILTVHVDGRPANRGLVGAGDFSAMKPEVVFVNTSRGFVVDNHALADFLIRRRGARALLDVHEPEPISASYPLLDLPNAHLSPHIASSTALANRSMSWVVKDVWRVLSGEPPHFPAW
jgi:phosphoglycerate dehydrogenase-like enzyme